MTTDNPTGAALNRKIAVARGWRVVHELVSGSPLPNPWATRVFEGDRLRRQWFTPITIDVAWDIVFDADEGYLPDWAGDPGEALLLCLSIADKHPNSAWTWKVELFHGDDESYVALFSVGRPMVYGRGTGETPALALARLALAALT